MENMTFDVRAFKAREMKDVRGDSSTFIEAFVTSIMNCMNASSAFLRGLSTLFWKYVQFPVARPIVRPMNTSASHFATLPKNVYTATTAFQINWNAPAIVFRTASNQGLGGGVTGAV